MIREKKRPAKNKCWVQFSRFVRLRDCLKTTGTTTKGKCCSCGREHPFGKLQAGHFLPGRTDNILFDEKGVHAQCYFCNCERQGNWPGYYRFMQKEYGQNVIERMVNDFISDSGSLYTVRELSAQELYYRIQVNKLLKKVNDAPQSNTK